jgi:beta-galactosidase
MLLGCCYYPEHWPEEWWPDDARRMREMGLSRVRIGEFAWSRIEPEPGRFEWGWLDRAIEVLAGEGLGIILGTPTATPPKWLVDSMPDMIAIDEAGRPRRFGSRRHYCFSHAGYREQAVRIATAMADRYGAHPAIIAWQIDNEYGCHDTVPSTSAAAVYAFREWLAARYADVGTLNSAWGAVFWSAEYRDFNEIDLPFDTVTEANPSHMLDFRRFSSDQVAAFNIAQVNAIRPRSPGRDVVHNFMGFFTQFDHHKVARDLDVATWDSYPLGFLEQFWFKREDKLRYARQGHPDIAAFHHDLYRGCGRGRWWVMEQQPGPVNWARHNPAPLDGMVRLWTLEAMAHGAELTAYFRWRQAPFGQEQMHAGLLRPDRSDAQGGVEAKAAARDIAGIGEIGAPLKSVALLFSYEAAWVIDTQPQGADFRYLELVFTFYEALRRLGINVDILPPDASLDGYAMVVIPCLPVVDDALVERLEAFAGPVLIGPRSGSKDRNLAIIAGLPPGSLRRLIDLKVLRVESLREGLVEHGEGFAVERWIEEVESALPAEVRTMSGRGVVFRQNNVRYLCCWPDAALLDQLARTMALEAEVDVTPLPADLRLRRTADCIFAFNYGPAEIDLSQTWLDAGDFNYRVGGALLPPAGVAVWAAPAGTCVSSSPSAQRR